MVKHLCVSTEVFTVVLGRPLVLVVGQQEDSRTHKRSGLEVESPLNLANAGKPAFGKSWPHV